MNDELERIWKEAVILKSRYYHDIFMKDLRKTMKTSSMASIQAEIRTEHLPDTGLERYCCLNLLGF
jgi:DNA-directed RNA polymerase subunit N (RpoN/RPB10)